MMQSYRACATPNSTAFDSSLPRAELPRFNNGQFQSLAKPWEQVLNMHGVLPDRACVGQQCSIKCGCSDHIMRCMAGWLHMFLPLAGWMFCR